MHLFRIDDGMVRQYGRPTLLVQAFPVVRETAKCYVLHGLGKPKFVLKDPNGKRFAYLERADAMASYVRRKRRQVEILAHRHDTAQKFLDEVQRQIAGEESTDETMFFASPGTLQAT